MTVAAGYDNFGMVSDLLGNQNDQTIAQSAEAVKNSAQNTRLCVAADELPRGFDFDFRQQSGFFRKRFGGQSNAR